MTDTETKWFKPVRSAGSNRGASVASARPAKQGVPTNFPSIDRSTSGARSGLGANRISTERTMRFEAIRKLFSSSDDSELADRIRQDPDAQIYLNRRGLMIGGVALTASPVVQSFVPEQLVKTSTLADMPSHTAAFRWSGTGLAFFDTAPIAEPTIRAYESWARHYEQHLSNCRIEATIEYLDNIGIDKLPALLETVTRVR